MGLPSRVNAAMPFSSLIAFPRVVFRQPRVMEPGLYVSLFSSVLVNAWAPSLSAFFERGSNPATHSKCVSAPHSAHAPLAHLHSVIERRLSRSCGLSAELQHLFLGEL